MWNTCVHQLLFSRPWHKQKHWLTVFLRFADAYATATSSVPWLWERPAHVTPAQCCHRALGTWSFDAMRGQQGHGHLTYCHGCIWLNSRQGLHSTPPLELLSPRVFLHLSLNQSMGSYHKQQVCFQQMSASYSHRNMFRSDQKCISDGFWPCSMAICRRSAADIAKQMTTMLHASWNGL